MAVGWDAGVQARTDAAGRAVPGAVVCLRWEEVRHVLAPLRPFSRVPTATTDSHGNFRLATYRQGGPVQVYAAKAGLAAGVSERITATDTAGRTNLVIRLSPTRTAKLRVRGEGGEVPQRVEVLFRGRPHDPFAPGPPGKWWGTQDAVTTAADFCLFGLNGRAFDLYLHAPGWVPQKVASDRIIPAEGTAVREVRVTLLRGHSIEGCVLDAKGDPVTNLLVHVNPGRSGGRANDPFFCRHPRTDSEGCFKAEGLPDGVYILRAHLPGPPRTELYAEGIRAGTGGHVLRPK